MWHVCEKWEMQKETISRKTVTGRSLGDVGVDRIILKLILVDQSVLAWAELM